VCNQGNSECRRSLCKTAKAVNKRSTAAERYNLLEQRRRLSTRIALLEKKADSFMILDAATKWRADKGRDSDDILDSSEDEWEDSDAEEDVLCPEDAKLPLPSSLATGEVERLGLQEITRQEAQLRRGQINDALDGLRLALGEKSLLLRTEVRNARSQITSLRAWDSVKKQDASAIRHKKVYEVAREALQRLCNDDEYLLTLHDITPEDMKMSGDIVEENRVGQRSDVLAWFWRIADDHEDSEHVDSDRMKECKPHSPPSSNGRFTYRTGQFIA
jgi:hypothetical protein